MDPRTPRPIPLLLVFDVVVLLLAGAVLRYTAFGRALFATGSNQEAARLNGISIARVLIAVYAIAGLAAGLAAIVLVGRLTAASATSDPTLLLTVLKGRTFLVRWCRHPRSDAGGTRAVVVAPAHEERVRPCPIMARAASPARGAGVPVMGFLRPSGEAGFPRARDARTTSPSLA